MKQTSKNWSIIIFTFLITALAAIIAIGVGSVYISVPDILQTILHPTTELKEKKSF